MGGRGGQRVRAGVRRSAEKLKTRDVVEHRATESCVEIVHVAAACSG